MENNGNSDKETKLFRKLERETPPPAELKESIIAQLQNEGQLKINTDMKTNWTFRIAAGIIIFVAGGFLGMKFGGGTTVINPTQGYVLLLHEDQGFTPGPGEQMFEEYSGWRKDLFDKGIVITGQELADREAMIAPSGDVTVTEVNPEKISGYFILEAASLEEAVKLASSAPHLKYGGSIEVRPFMIR